jgi:hypothetical protein
MVILARPILLFSMFKGGKAKLLISQEAIASK